MVLKGDLSRVLWWNNSKQKDEEKWSEAEDKCPLGDISSSLGRLKVDVIQPNVAEVRISASSESFWTLVQRGVHSHRGKDIKTQKIKQGLRSSKKRLELKTNSSEGQG